MVVHVLMRKPLWKEWCAGHGAKASNEGMVVQIILRKRLNEGMVVHVLVRKPQKEGMVMLGIVRKSLSEGMVVQVTVRKHLIHGILRHVIGMVVTSNASDASNYLINKTIAEEASHVV
ncbi:hypothetical protein PoB_005762800 [Plakobranchus ocellatus]|uniref:Uncharacterized protein n=1 Tax=Plakobranchus ocellatus TaxID=259542 RepID=A0AAV4CJ71_9GAST|nr:hypothetical protein PoB_005762800 [Plakobranchus ocellatus]